MISKLNSFQKSLVWKLIPVAIAIPFVIQTITGMNQGGSHNPNYLVNFKDEKSGITYAEYQRDYQSQYNALLQRLGAEKFEELMTPENERELKMSVLNSLINERSIVLYSDKIGVRITDEDVSKAIVETKNFQDSNGKFDQDRFKRFLDAYNISVEQYFSILANNMRVNAIRKYFDDSIFTVPTEVDINQKMALPSAQIQVATVEAEKYISDITPTEEQLQDYYNTHKSAYEVPAEAVISYIIYSQAELLKKAPVPTAEQIRKYFDDNPKLFSNYTYDVSLIQTADLKTANEVIANLEAGASFAEQAKEYSIDVGTKSEGGRLGVVSPQDLPPQIAKIVEIMEVGSHSQAIQTEDGFFVVKLDKKEFQSKDFNEAKAGIEKDLTRLYQQNYLIQVRDKIQEVVDNGGKITDVAKDLGFKVETTKSFQQDKVPEPLTAAIAKLAFTGVLEVGKVNNPQALGDKEVVLQLDQFKELTYKPFADVKADVEKNTKLNIAQSRQVDRLNQVAARLNAKDITDEQVASILKEANLNLSELRTLSFYSAGQDNLPYYRTLFTSSFNGHKVDYITVPIESSHVVYLLAVHGFTTDKVDKTVAEVFKQSFPNQVTEDYFANMLNQIRKELGVDINFDMLGGSDDNN